MGRLLAWCLVALPLACAEHSERPEPATLRGALVSAELDLGGVPVSAPTLGFQRAPTAAYLGGQYLLAWTDDRAGLEEDVYGARVSPDASVLDPTGIVICTAPGSQF